MPRIISTRTYALSCPVTEVISKRIGSFDVKVRALSGGYRQGVMLGRRLTEPRRK